MAADINKRLHEEEVRDQDLEPYVTLRYIARLFKILAILMVVMLVGEVITGLVTEGTGALMTLIGEATKLLVIGGLIDDQDSKGVSKVPVLGDIPIIGVFFRSKTSRKTRNELLVFVTPRIIRD